ncbi:MULTISPECIES: DUF3429 domain-containing protein [unclassified Guyparkeria]|uniref:DUF3429 domain-containing protein n=1 Tax=unclassified Guyparkeria TaxID=2626246 RepID=UPI00073362A1|nr:MULTISPECIES: DUF3429 domain-containing protein [unclassified Guyparkeria]KTG16836.1 hypothetical protein AUR63_01870 [Guyparkeria sp. XI15]OAE85870.1 hypothetical protein AWR35_01870 [Guyparkeria sp. WRN-7]
MRATAYLIALGLLLPFWGLALLAWLGPFVWVAPALDALSAYAAVMLGFLGAIHWGVVLATTPAERALLVGDARHRLAWGALLVLVAWVAAMLPWAVLSLSLLFLLLVVSWQVDRHWLDNLPVGWSYPRLRQLFTLLAALALLVAIASWLRPLIPGSGA